MITVQLPPPLVASLQLFILVFGHMTAATHGGTWGILQANIVLGPRKYVVPSGQTEQLFDRPPSLTQMLSSLKNVFLSLTFSCFHWHWAPTLHVNICTRGV